MKAALWIAGLAVIGFLLLPVLVIVPLSFSAGSFLHYPLPGFSLRWYAAFFASGQTATLCDLWGNYVPGNHFISWRRHFTPFAGPGLAVDDMLDRVIMGQRLLDPVAATAGSPALYVAVTDVSTSSGVTS